MASCHAAALVRYTSAGERVLIVTLSSRYDYIPWGIWSRTFDQHLFESRLRYRSNDFQWGTSREDILGHAHSVHSLFWKEANGHATSRL